jgi:hypothetical protein
MATLDALEARVDALEDLLGDAQSDQLAPNVLTVNPDGSIGATFTGHVHAAGLDLDAAIGPTILPAFQIRWLKAADGSVVAQQVAIEDAGGGRTAEVETTAQTDNNDSTGVSSLTLTAANNSQTSWARLSALQSGYGSGGSASITAALVQNGVLRQNPTIIDDLGRSNFLQLLATAKRQVQFGTLGAVNSDGGGWCNYTLPTAFPTALDFVLAMNTFLGASGTGFLDVQGVDPGHFRCFVNSAGTNCSCMYIAIGH